VVGVDGHTAVEVAEKVDLQEAGAHHRGSEGQGDVGGGEAGAEVVDAFASVTTSDALNGRFNASDGDGVIRVDGAFGRGQGGAGDGRGGRLALGIIEEGQGDGVGVGGRNQSAKIQHVAGERSEGLEGDVAATDARGGRGDVLDLDDSIGNHAAGSSFIGVGHRAGAKDILGRLQEGAAVGVREEVELDGT